MKKASTLFLKSVILLIGVAALAIYVFVLPWLVRGSANVEPLPAFARWLAIASLYGTSIPLYFTLYQAICILRYIDSGQAFSSLAAKALSKIKYSAATICALLLAVMPAVYYVADADDAPGLILIGMMIALAPFVIAAFSAVLQRLFEEAIAIKSENELIV